MALARYDGTAVDTAGNVIPNATVEVRRDQPGRPVVPLWGDREGTVALGNPIQTDAQGGFGFHVTGGVYYIRIFTGPSQQPTFQKILRYVGIGTAGERDVEELASALEAGTATFPTLPELEAFTPSGEGIGGKVTTGEDAGFYHYDMIEEEWVFDRPLYDSLARMNVTGGTADAIEAEVAAGVDSASVVMLFFEPDATNTGPVTINGMPLLSAGGIPLGAGELIEGRTYWFTDEGANYKLRPASSVVGIEIGDVETLPAGEEATVTSTPTAGGFVLDFELPRGATGDIDGVTAFWQSRITVDGDAADALSGLGFSDFMQTLIGDEDAAEACETLGILPVIQSPQGRCTLSSTVPLTTADISGASTIYYLPVAGQYVPIFDGTEIKMHSFGAGLTLPLDPNSGHVGYHQLTNAYDIFAVMDGSTLRLATGPSWAAGAVSGSLSARGTGAGSTELETFNGLMVNKNNITARFGSSSGDTVSIPARQATYLGSFCCDGNGTVPDNKVQRWLFNAYNQGFRVLRRTDPTTIWNYLGSTFQIANANANNFVAVFLGLSGPIVDVNVKAAVINNTATPRAVSVGISKDGTNISPDCFCSLIGVSNYHISIDAKYCEAPGLGYHIFYWMERGGGADIQTWTGTNTGTLSGIFGKVLM